MCHADHQKLTMAHFEWRQPSVYRLEMAVPQQTLAMAHFGAIGTTSKTEVAMNKTQLPEAPPWRTLLQRLFGAGIGQNLIKVWVTETGSYAFGQVVTETKVKLGRYTVLQWKTYRTPDLDREE